MRFYLESILVPVDDFFNRYPFFVAGVVFIWLFVIPATQEYLTKYKDISTLDALKKLKDDPNAQLLDIRDNKTLRVLGSPNLKIFSKNVVQVKFRDGDDEGFAKKVKENFEDPANTTIYILDNFNGNSMMVAELLFNNGFKEAYAIRGGVRGNKSDTKNNIVPHTPYDPTRSVQEILHGSILVTTQKLQSIYPFAKSKILIDVADEYGGHAEVRSQSCVNYLLVISPSRSIRTQSSMFVKDIASCFQNEVGIPAVTDNKIPQPFTLNESSFLSKSADIAPDMNSTIQKQDNAVSQSSIPPKDIDTHQKTTNNSKFLSDTAPDMPLSVSPMEDLLCSVVPCSFSSDNTPPHVNLHNPKRVSPQNTDNTPPHVAKARDVGVNSIVLFPKVPDALKTPTGDETYNDSGLIPRTIRLLKDKYPDLTEMVFSSKDSTIIYEDIDRIIAKGEEGTAELDAKMKKFTEDAIKFKMDDSMYI
ncbi:unnamed protein product [Lactuca virosa]|uniref:porphobilinogen synthase n=1 Tax=Lactuca virosa TaxID=75947 RepID=A0AAU9LKZ1_9ASTR|nr:unnamed protein product [Lactuca virosa]